MENEYINFSGTIRPVSSYWIELAMINCVTLMFYNFISSVKCVMHMQDMYYVVAQFEVTLTFTAICRVVQMCIFGCGNWGWRGIDMPNESPGCIILMHEFLMWNSTHGCVIKCYQIQIHLAYGSDRDCVQYLLPMAIISLYIYITIFDGVALACQRHL